MPLVDFVFECYMKSIYFNTWSMMYESIQINTWCDKIVLWNLSISIHDQWCMNLSISIHDVIKSAMVKYVIRNMQFGQKSAYSICWNLGKLIIASTHSINYPETLYIRLWILRNGKTQCIFVNGIPNRVVWWNSQSFNCPGTSPTRTNVGWFFVKICWQQNIL